MRRTTSATWSSLTSSSPLPLKSLSTRLHNIAEIQEFPGNRKKKDQWNCKSATRGERKKAPSTPSGAADANLETRTHCERKTKERNFPCHYIFRSIRSAIEVQSSSPLKALISLLFFSLFLLLFFFWLEN